MTTRSKRLPLLLGALLLVICAAGYLLWLNYYSDQAQARRNQIALANFIKKSQAMLKVFCDLPKKLSIDSKKKRTDEQFSALQKKLQTHCKKLNIGNYDVKRKAISMCMSTNYFEETSDIEALLYKYLKDDKMPHDFINSCGYYEVYAEKLKQDLAHYKKAEPKKHQSLCKKYQALGSERFQRFQNVCK